jgi:hypothetical protein
MRLSASRRGDVASSFTFLDRPNAVPVALDAWRFRAVRSLPSSLVFGEGAKNAADGKRSTAGVLTLLPAFQAITFKIRSRLTAAPDSSRSCFKAPI